MPSSRLAFLSLLGLLGFVTAGSPPALRDSNSNQNGNRPILANLRIEGPSHTIFEGKFFTQGHDVTTDSGGTHHCDGTNNHAHPNPGPTATGALDDASKLPSNSSEFTWDGLYDQTFDDYAVTRIANTKSNQTSNEFWALIVNYKLAPVGGCQQQITKTDEVVWAFNAFNKKHFLKLAGPKKARKNQPITVTVTDGASGKPIAGASVEGHKTNAQGKATISFSDIGPQFVKADKADSIRSGFLEVDVTA